MTTPNLAKRVEVYIDYQDRDKNSKLLKDLEVHRERIESQLGQSLDFQPLENRRACRVAIVRPGSIEDDDTLEAVRDWMVENLLKFKQVFDPLLAELTK